MILNQHEGTLSFSVKLRNIFKQPVFLGNTNEIVLASTHTTINTTRSKIIHVINVSVVIKFPQTCPAPASQKITVIIFGIKDLLLSMHRHMI